MEENLEEKFDPDERINARWCVDSETGDGVLIDIRTNKILWRRDDGFDKSL